MTLVLPDGAARDRFDNWLVQRGRRLIDIPQSALGAVQRAGECHVWIADGHCNCDTALVSGLDRVLAPSEAQIRARLEAKVARKGWSAKKAALWVEQKLAADAQRQVRNANPDDISAWTSLLQVCLTDLAMPRLAILRHFYSGPLSEPGPVVRTAAPHGVPLPDLLSRLQPDTLLELS